MTATTDPSPDRSAAGALPRWLEVIDGSSRVLLIAPHGGRAGPASRRRSAPKVNDLHTAEITRELAARLSASAIINAGMDRNQLDCNRLGQLIESAPWLLELIAQRAEQIVERHRRAIVLVIHGWNIIEPRIDFGVGARLRDGRLVPAGSAHISAGDEFINRTVAPLAKGLARDGILPSFGHRYPAGGFHNLLQAFTPRHLASPSPALRRLAALAEKRAIEAVQLELSVAVRMAGTRRERALEAIADAFSGDHESAAPAESVIPVVRSVAPKSKAAAGRAERPPTPTRVGIEFYDPAAGLGAMASFDLGAGAIGARIMMLLPGGRAALFTSEGAVHREGSRLTLGPLRLEAGRSEAALRFSGPVVLVPDGTAYLSIERALASGVLDESAQMSVRLGIIGASPQLDKVLAGEIVPETPSDWPAAFGRLTGTIVIDGASRKLDALARFGVSFSGLGASRFVSRRMVWACFPGDAPHFALEARVTSSDDGVARSHSRALGNHGWTRCEVTQLELETRSIDAPPEKIAASLAIDGLAETTLSGEVRSFVPLSRPGPNQSRIYTSLGFADFRLGDSRGAGMFEYSRRSEQPLLESGLASPGASAPHDATARREKP